VVNATWGYRRSHCHLAGGLPTGSELRDRNRRRGTRVARREAGRLLKKGHLRRCSLLRLCGVAPLRLRAQSVAPSI